MTTHNVHDAWNSFWDRQARQRKGGSGLMPSTWRGIDAAQGAAWMEFAKRLPSKACVLDLATGDGRVLSHLLQRRRDLKLLGIDRAATLPTPPRGSNIRGGTEMDRRHGKLPRPLARRCTWAAVTLRPMSPRC
ncbi:class I SAM-dependent methyltransferase [Aurantiacibacter rhizosphaerae]|uniref:Class I SAM-dependent methyltransferase n=1 Tax=Aurantiacibacter rhizosphaerae TaxID=2691582 RepID=A0A844XDZ2_9SPHN|nr:class I SAM-dependent methyltransferase [Aurantiacibacter rhizosphaerae]MWV28236.1 hypothetical protein [Aurantiacibacter rhizosphaerae]